MRHAFFVASTALQVRCVDARGVSRSSVTASLPFDDDGEIDIAWWSECHQEG